MEILFLLAVVRQSKIMKQKAGMENDDEDEEEEEEKEKTAWGKGKRIYYSADNIEYEVTLFCAFCCLGFHHPSVVQA
jgi:hypothetical protein